MNPTAGKTTLTARSPEDLLALVPLVLGFHPTESLVMLTFGPDRGAFHARVDLPGRDEIDGVVDLLLSAALRNRIDRVVFVLYTDDADAAFEIAPLLVSAFVAEQIGVIDLLRTDGTRWFPLAGGPDHEGTAYDVSAHPFTAQGVYDGAVTQPTRLALAESLVGPVDEVAQVEAEIPARLGRVPDLQRTAEARWLVDLIGRCTSSDESPVAGELARLVVAVLDVELRDVAWTHMNHANARAHVELWSDVVRRTPDDFVAAPATLLAFAAWLTGQGALAWCALDRVHDVDPAYSLAELVAGALTAAMPPSSWTPVPVGSHPLLA